VVKKKSYMSDGNLLKEGFFNKLSTFLKNRPKVKGKKKLGILKSLKLALGVSGLNSAINDYEKLVKKELGDDYPDLPRFQASDFIK